MAAKSLHLAASRGPSSGTRSSQSGGCGTDQEASDWIQPAMSDEWSTIVESASVSGTSKPSSSNTVITATANPRRPHNTDCTRIIRGQVATTIMVAQITAGRNGRNTQK